MTRAELLARLGRVADADRAYGRALALAANTTERRFIGQRRDQLEA